MNIQEIEKQLNEQGIFLTSWIKYGKERYYLNSNNDNYLEKANVYITPQKNTNKKKYVFLETEKYVVTGEKCYNGSVQKKVDEIFKNINVKETWIDPAGGSHSYSSNEFPHKQYE